MRPLNIKDRFLGKHYPPVLFVVVLVLMLYGCSTTAKHEGMTPLTFEPGTKHPKTVSINVVGGEEFDGLGRPQISNGALKQALADSITKSQMFSAVIEGMKSDYFLMITIFSFDQPVFGFSFTVKMEAGWTLKDAVSGETVWQEAIKSENTATTEDAFAARTRLRLAVEGAARNNISQGLEKISRLNL